MIPCSNRPFVLLGAAMISAFLLHASNVPAAGVSAAPVASDACALLTPADIAKASGIKVWGGIAGEPVPGVLDRCTWTGANKTRVIVTLEDAQHIRLTIAAAEQTGGQSVPGLGTEAVGMKGAAFTGGGYIVNVLDAKGGFGASILGQEGTRDGAIALAKIVESHR